MAFNVGRFANLRARWNDAGGFFTWNEPPLAWSTSQTPLQYFNTERVFNNILSSSDFSNRGWMEWANTGGRFSDQVCAKKRAVAHCSPSGHCTRWGMHYNNECDYTSNDAMNGIGMNLGGRVNGDWAQCCQQFAGVNRGMAVQLWGRAATVY